MGVPVKPQRSADELASKSFSNSHSISSVATNFEPAEETRVNKISLLW